MGCSSKKAAAFIESYGKVLIYKRVVGASIARPWSLTLPQNYTGAQCAPLRSLCRRSMNSHPATLQGGAFILIFAKLPHLKLHTNPLKV